MCSTYYEIIGLLWTAAKESSVYKLLRIGVPNFPNCSLFHYTFYKRWDRVSVMCIFGYIQSYDYSILMPHSPLIYSDYNQLTCRRRLTMLSEPCPKPDWLSGVCWSPISRVVANNISEDCIIPPLLCYATRQTQVWCVILKCFVTSLVSTTQSGVNVIGLHGIFNGGRSWNTWFVDWLI